MDTQNKIEKITVQKEQKSKQEEQHCNLLQPSIHQKSTTALPPSSSSSPSREFSFTISLHSSPQSIVDGKRKSPTSIAIDLSPADDIFFHGHLLPLHLLSHFSSSPRVSTTSLDSFNPTIRDLFNNSKLTSNSYDNDDDGDKDYSSNTTNASNCTAGSKERSKPKPFALFKLVKWRKAVETGERQESKRKLRFNVRRVWKRYVKVVRPLLFFRGRERERHEIHRQPHSFSGNLNSFKWKEWGARRRGGFSAPASMRTSPTNSGLLLATATISSSNDSTMEELQNAIQAAIAHCKNSIAAKEETVQLAT